MTKLPLAAALIGLASMAAAQTPPAAAVPPPPGLKPGYDAGSSYASAKGAGISFDQWATKAREQLMALDANHDGKVSKDEFAARAGMMGGRPAEAPAAGANASAPGQDGGRGARMFDRFDANQDGLLDAQEINAILARRFARMDANHDGVLTPDERQSMRGGNAPEQ